jgi:hypothetical protein
MNGFESFENGGGMKSIIFASVALLSLTVGSSLIRKTRGEASSFGVFSGTSPCTDLVRPILGIPVGAKCDRIKWQLSLNHDPNTLRGTTFKLMSEYGFHVDNRTYEPKGSKSMAGTWKIIRGRPTDPDATVFQLDGDKPHSISFLLVDPSVLHLLDSNKSLMVGNSGASYTLNRNEKVMKPINLSAQQTVSGKYALPSENDSPVSAAFAGRSPCREVARELNRAVGTDCNKLKWDLTLYRDPKTLAPTNYQLKGTLYRDHIREGKWKVLRGTKTNPNAVVYELDEASVEPLFLLKGDDGVLFFLARDGSFLIGNEEFSYTLNRHQ